MALSADRALIGAPITNDGFLGVVHLYERTPNDLLFYLDSYRDSGGEPFSEFGVSVALGDDMAVIGAWDEVEDGDGKAFIFDFQ